MFKQELYGVPIDLESTLSDYFTAEMKQLAMELLSFLKEKAPTLLIQQYKDNKFFNTALAYLAFLNKAPEVISIIYDITEEDLQRVHFEWHVPHPDVHLSFSNYYFLVFYNELYAFDEDRREYYLTNRGIILRALADLSYTPWESFLLPVSEKMHKDFLWLTLINTREDFPIES
jgi:hypothetical protein